MYIPGVSYRYACIFLSYLHGRWVIDSSVIDYNLGTTLQMQGRIQDVVTGGGGGAELDVC